MALRLHQGVQALVTLAMAMALAACAPEPPAGATHNKPSKDDLFLATFVPNEADAQAMLASMREAVPGPEVQVAPARHGVRWSDVPNAVRWGGNVAEMATYTHERDGDDGWIYHLISVADEPVTLTIRRVPPPKVYEAHAVAGLFGDRRDLERRLLHELDLAMRMYGAKAQPVTLDEPE